MSARAISMWGGVGVLAVAAAAAACSDTAPARDQWKVYLATDAPVPSFGQQLAVELIDEEGKLVSPEQRRLIDASHPSDWPISFGIVPSPGHAPPRLRAQLYRLDQLGVMAVPEGASFIDATARLPAPSGLTTVAMSLMMSCFSIQPQLGAATSCDASSGRLAPERTLTAGIDPGTLPAPGSWAPAKTIPCKTMTDGMVCMPGGAFLMGAARYDPSLRSDDPTPERLVQLSPFEIDAFEVTVGQVRQLVRAGRLGTAPVQGDFASYDSGAGPCTYAGAGDASHDAYPINCIAWDLARQVCDRLGKRLPSEAEWEYAAGNLGAKTPFPWGSSTDVCRYAIVARGRLGVASDASECLTAGVGQALSPGPVPGGDPLDVTERGVHDMGGNMAEWTIDHFAPYTAPCWSSSVLLKDPACVAAAADLLSVRGGGWTFLPALASSFLRDAATRGETGIDIGLRCVKSSQ